MILWLMPRPAGVEVRRVGALVGWGWEPSRGGRGGGVGRCGG